MAINRECRVREECGLLLAHDLCATVNRGIGDQRRLRCRPLAASRTTAAGLGGVQEPVGKQPCNADWTCATVRDRGQGTP